MPNPTPPKQRGSEKLMSAWRHRVLSEDAVQEIAKSLDESAAHVLGVSVVGGQHATGVQLTLAYEGDDIPRCGNDLTFWLKWHLKHGGEVKPPRIIIDGIPWPEIVKMVIDYGDTSPTQPSLPGGLQKELGGSLGG